MDLVQFTKEILGIELNPLQLEALMSREKYSIISAARQSGKTMMALVLALYEATRKMKTVMYLVPNNRMEQTLMRRCFDMTSAPGFQREHGPVRTDNNSNLAFVNGSVIAFRTPTPHGLIGWAVENIITDDCHYLNLDQEQMRWAITQHNGDITRFHTFGEDGRDEHEVDFGLRRADHWKTITMTQDRIITSRREFIIDGDGNLQAKSVIAYEN